MTNDSRLRHALQRFRRLKAGCRWYPRHKQESFVLPPRGAVLSEPDARLIGEYEAHMSAPTARDWLIDDGMVMTSIDGGLIRSWDGRWWAGAILGDDRRKPAIELYDRLLRACYRLPSAVTGGVPLGFDHGRLVIGRRDDGRAIAALPLRDVATDACRIPLRAIKDLLGPEDRLPHLPEPVIRHVLADSRLLEAVWTCPQELRKLDRPLDGLSATRHRLSFEGKDTGFEVSSFRRLMGGSDGSFVLPGQRRHADGSGIGCWLWHRRGAWQWVDEYLETGSGHDCWLDECLDVSADRLRFRCHLGEYMGVFFRLNTSWAGSRVLGADRHDEVQIEWPAR